ERLAVLTASRPQVSLFRERSDAESASVIGARHARRGRHHETRHRGHHREIRGHHGIHHYGIRHRGRGTLLHHGSTRRAHSVHNRILFLENRHGPSHAGRSPGLRNSRGHSSHDRKSQDVHKTRDTTGLRR